LTPAPVADAPHGAVCFSVLQDGRIDRTSPYVAESEDLRLPVGSSGRVLLLAAYADAVTSGELNGWDAVSADEWALWHLPGLDDGAHDAALEGVTFPVTLDAVVGAMMLHGDPAAASLIAARLGPLQGFGQRNDVLRSDVWLSPLERALALHNHDAPLTQERLDELLSWSPGERQAEGARLAERFVQDADWRAAEQRFRRGVRRGPPTRWVVAGAELASPRGTAEEYARMLAGMAAGTWPSADAAQVMARHLEPGVLESQQIAGSSWLAVGAQEPVTVAVWLGPGGQDWVREQVVVGCSATGSEPEGEPPAQ
jgi:hypothetical protein